MTTHPMHLFDPVLKGLAGKSTRPVRLSPTTQNDVFLNALLETATTKTVRRSPLQWAAATGLHIVILATLIIAPLYTTGTIQLGNYKDTPLVPPPLHRPRLQRRVRRWLRTCHLRGRSSPIRKEN